MDCIQPFLCKQKTHNACMLRKFSRCNLPSRSSYIRTKLFLIFSSEIFPKYDCITSMIFRRNSNTIAAFTFCFVTAANQMFARWKQTKTIQILQTHLTQFCIPKDYRLEQCSCIGQLHFINTGGPSHTRRFSIHGFSYPRFTTAPKNLEKLKK